MAFDLSAPVAVDVNFVGVECESGEAEEGGVCLLVVADVLG